MSFYEKMLTVEDQKAIKDIFDEARRYFPLIEHYKKQDILESGAGWSTSQDGLVETFGVVSGEKKPDAYHSRELAGLMSKFTEQVPFSSQVKNLIPLAKNKSKVVVSITRFYSSKIDLEFVTTACSPSSTLTFMMLDGPGLEDTNGHARRVTSDSLQIFRGSLHPEPTRPFQIRNYPTWGFLFVLSIHII